MSGLSLETSVQNLRFVTATVLKLSQPEWQCNDVIVTVTPLCAYTQNDRQNDRMPWKH